MHKFTVNMRKVRETKGAALYKEVDTDGNEVDQNVALIGTQYLRKIAFPNGHCPNGVSISVESLD